MKSCHVKLCATLFAIFFSTALWAADPAPVPATPAPVTTSSAQTIPLDGIAAVVNDDIITQGQLNDRYIRAVQQIENRKMAMPPRAILEKQLLDHMVNDKIQLQAASQTGIQVDGPTLDRAIEKIAQQNKLSLDSFKQALAHDGVPYDKFRSDIRNEIILDRLHQRDVVSKVNVTEAEVDAYLAQQSATGADQEFHLAHISIDIPDNATSVQIDAAKVKADEALKKLQQGADFAQISTLYSNAPNALEGGDLGWRPAAQLPPQFLEMVRQLKPGDLTGLLRSNDGFHILKLIAVRDVNQPAIIDQTHVRHILIKTNEVVSDQDAIKKLNQIRENILSGKVTFAEMAKQYSADGSASQGGDLGWVSPGETVPEFEQAMNALKIGEISQPIKSPFGYHLIQVLERRQKDVTLNHRRDLARQAIEARKVEEAQTEWLRELRDRAYVKYFPLPDADADANANTDTTSTNTDTP